MTEAQRKRINDRTCSEHLLMFKDAVRITVDVLKEHDVEIFNDELDRICDRFEDKCYLGSNNWLGVGK